MMQPLACKTNKTDKTDHVCNIPLQKTMTYFSVIYKCCKHTLGNSLNIQYSSRNKASCQGLETQANFLEQYHLFRTDCKIINCPFHQGGYYTTPRGASSVCCLKNKSFAHRHGEYSPFLRIKAYS